MDDTAILVLIADELESFGSARLIRHEGPWRDVDHVEAGTASWVLWFNRERPHGSIDDLTPLEVEQLDYARTEQVEQAGGHQQTALRTCWGESGIDGRVHDRNPKFCGLCAD